MLTLPEPWDTIATVVVWLLSGGLAGAFAHARMSKPSPAAKPASPADPLGQLRKELLYLLTMTAGGSGPPFPPDRAADTPGGPLAGSLLRLAEGILSDPSKPVDASLEALRPILALHRDLAAGPAALLAVKPAK